MSARTYVIVVAVTLGLTGCSAEPPTPDLRCASLPPQILAAQSVPEASYVPCIKDVSPPWSIVSTDSDQDRTQVTMEWSSSSAATERALITLQDACQTGTPSAPSDDVPSDVEVTQSTQGRIATTTYSFTGGCVEVDMRRARQHEVAPLSTEDFTVELVPREVLNAYVLEQTNGQVGLDPTEES